MRNLFTTNKAIVETVKPAGKKEDMLDLLLKLNSNELTAVMAEMKKGDPMVSKVEAIYDRKSDGKMKSTMLFMC
ncbi:hypothetical protein FDI85_gp138 [Erwinia phage Machina]|uniref:Uncharacterized protein n=2 Tax=Machinavirus machina TaxID=2169990 RepID=A0A1B2ID93_9CAUD|nr:hypothetical protein BIZ81_gp137 [Erwinia phage vB_EamM_Huxley]YP_009617063.1 hypothetical protein FDI85_gp138 [Erwinia phage Machina]ANZ49228.1 hypothetical protein HUXLEY_146 [Erwinia phage vB_EamM_Huxley]ANZ49784.1 hypothetical protein MACHINA_146 [Erwinia phage Machina]ANZ50056.1 hypothetical protein PARSHIK_147 [Erwinia phage vB_EamM_Parshik]